MEQTEIKVNHIETKSVMTKSNTPIGGYSVNPYVGCPHACKYCYASFMKRFTGHTEEWGTFMDVKDWPEIKNPKKYAGQKVIIGTVTDGYNPLEETYKNTRRFLEELKDSGADILISTKSDLVLRDLDLLKEINGNSRLTIPQSGVLFLRCNENTPDEMTVELALPDGKEVSYSMPILKMIEYDADTIFDKELYLIAPFYLFNLEHYFKNVKEMSEEDKKAFTENLKKFKQNLDNARDDKKLDDYAYRSILDLFNKVAVALTEGKEEVYRETEAIMGGQVLEYEAKTILNQGKAETKNEDIKNLAEYFVKETPTLSYEDAVKMAESILKK